MSSRQALQSGVAVASGLTHVFELPGLHVIIPVAGTTQPLNFSANSRRDGNEADATYWDTYAHFRPAVMALTKRFEIHDIWWGFGWNGWNSVEERRIAGVRLFEEIKRRYGDLLCDRLRLHFICHSHGGQLVNEAITMLDSDPLAMYWKVQSVTYLSTPFFREIHPLQMRHCAARGFTIVNVSNSYDLTQRIVAGFSIQNVQEFFARIAAHWLLFCDRTREAHFQKDVFKALAGAWLNAHEAGLVWANSIILAESLRPFVRSIRDEVTSLYGVPDTEMIASLLADIDKQLAVSARALKDRRSDSRSTFRYTRKTYLEDLGLTEWSSLLRRLNEFLWLDRAGESQILRWLTHFLTRYVVDHFEQPLAHPPIAAWDIPRTTRIVEVDVSPLDPFGPLDGSTCYRLTSESIARIARTTSLHLSINGETGASVKLPDPRLRPLTDTWFVGDLAFRSELERNLGNADVAAHWHTIREQAEKRKLDFGSFISFAEQAALTAMRARRRPTALLPLINLLISTFLEAQFDLLRYIHRVETVAKALKLFTWGSVDLLLAAFIRNCSDYGELIRDNYHHTTASTRETSADLTRAGVRPASDGGGFVYGSFEYFAVRAHSVSRMGKHEVMDRVFNALRASGTPLYDSNPPPPRSGSSTRRERVER